MNPFFQIAHGVIGGGVIASLLIWRTSFGLARHPISILGAIAIIIANLYFFRSKKIIRFGDRRTWLKYHQRFASLGVTLIFIHSAMRPSAWHSWIAFLIASSSFATGFFVSLTRSKKRKTFLLIHSFLSPILLISIIFHGSKKLDHDRYIPLKNPHNVACVKCHTTPNYDRYTCRNCHAHNTDEIKLAHQIHGVIPYEPKIEDFEIVARCFDCHQAKIGDLIYGKRRANWDYD